MLQDNQLCNADWKAGCPVDHVSILEGHQALSAPMEQEDVDRMLQWGEVAVC
jgi:hypothetical protein